ALDEIRTTEGCGNDGLSSLVELLRKSDLLGRHVHVAFAVADADEESEDGDVVRVRRGQLEDAGGYEARVGAQGGHGVEAGAELLFEIFARVRLWIGIEGQEQGATAF